MADQQRSLFPDEEQPQWKRGRSSGGKGPRRPCMDCGARPRYRKHSRCLECLRPIMATIMKRRRQRHVAAGVCRDCGDKLPPDRPHGHCPPCLERHQAASKRWKRRLKIQCFEAYGGCRCSCCSEETIEFLTLDHANNDGAAHRKTSKKTERSGYGFYLRLKKLGFPQDLGLHVLCHNCQWGRQLCNGVCPHRRKK